MTRRDIINRLIGNVANNGTPTGPALAQLLHLAVDNDATIAKINGVEPTDPRKIILGVMKEMRDLMAVVRDELDGMDGVGKYR